jgi:hypothetical protein
MPHRLSAHKPQMLMNGRLLIDGSEKLPHVSLACIPHVLSRCLVSHCTCLHPPKFVIYFPFNCLLVPNSVVLIASRLFSHVHPRLFRFSAGQTKISRKISKKTGGWARSEQTTQNRNAERTHAAGRVGSSASFAFLLNLLM